MYSLYVLDAQPMARNLMKADPDMGLSLVKLCYTANRSFSGTPAPVLTSGQQVGFFAGRTAGQKPLSFQIPPLHVLFRVRDRQMPDLVDYDGDRVSLLLEMRLMAEDEGINKNLGGALVAVALNRTKMPVLYEFHPSA